MRHRKLVSVPLERTVLSTDLRSLGSLELHEVSIDPVRKAVFETLLAEEHHLGYGSAVGENLQVPVVYAAMATGGSLVVWRLSLPLPGA
jgi:hypothetical protein